MTNSKENIIKKFRFNSDSILHRLPAKDKKELEDGMVYRKYKKGKNIFIEGFHPTGIFYVKEGKIKKYKTHRDGKEQIIYICSSDELFGYSALISEESYPDSAAALTDVTVGFIPKEIFYKVLDRSPVLSINLLKNFSHEFGVMVNNITFARRSVRERLALALLVLQDKFRKSEDPHAPVEIVLTRDELAGMVGTAVETLIRLLRDFKNEGLIETQGRKIKILNSAKIIEITNI